MDKNIKHVATAIILVIGVSYNQFISADPPSTNIKVNNVKQQDQQADADKVSKDSSDLTEEKKKHSKKHSHESRLKKQAKIVDLIREKASDHWALLDRANKLEKLTENKIVIASHNIDESKINPHAITPIEIDVFEKENLIRIAIVTLIALFQSQKNNNFIMSGNTFFDRINSSESLKKEIKAFVDFLTNMSSAEEDILEAIELTDHMIQTLNSTIGIDNPLGTFITMINGGFKLLNSKKIAKEYLEKHGKNIVKFLTDFNKSASASFGAGGAFAGLKASGSVSASISEGASHNSLTGISKTVGGQFKVGAAPLSATLGVNFTKMLAFSSIIQRVDHGSKLTLSGEGKKLAELRGIAKLINRLFYSMFNEGMALPKILGVVPQEADFTFDHFADSNRPTRMNVINKELGLGVSALNSLGLSIKAIHSTMNVINENNNLLQVVTTDCYDDSGALNDLINKKLNRISVFIPKIDKQKFAPAEQVEIAMNTVLGDARYYMYILNSLAFWKAWSELYGNSETIQKTIDDLETGKHVFEKRWNVHGREELFESILLTISTLRNMHTTSKTVELGKKIYVVLRELQELSHYSKNKGTRERGGQYDSNTKKKILKIQISGSFPGGGSVTATVQKELKKDGNFQPFLTISMTVPGAIAGTFVKWAQEVVQALQGMKKTSNSQLNENTIYIVEALQAGIGILNLNLPNVKQTSTFNINFVNGFDGRPVISHYQITTTSGVNLSVGGNVGVAQLTASASANIGTTRFIPGSNTWWYPKTKLGALGWGTPECKAIYEYQILPSLPNYAANMNDEDSDLRKETEKTVSEWREKAKNSKKDLKHIDSIWKNLISTAGNSENGYGKFRTAFKEYLAEGLKKKN